MTVRLVDSVTRSLIRDGKEGDANALSTLFARYQERVLRIVRLRLSQTFRDRLRLQSMDILQEYSSTPSENSGTFEPTTEASFLHWLSRIMENIIRDQLDYAGAGKRDALRSDPWTSLSPVPAGHVHLRDLIPDEGTSPIAAYLKTGHQEGRRRPPP